MTIVIIDLPTYDLENELGNEHYDFKFLLVDTFKG